MLSQMDQSVIRRMDNTTWVMGSFRLSLHEAGVVTGLKFATPDVQQDKYVSIWAKIYIFFHCPPVWGGVLTYIHLLHDTLSTIAYNI